MKEKSIMDMLKEKAHKLKFMLSMVQEQLQSMANRFQTTSLMFITESKL